MEAMQLVQCAGLILPQPVVVAVDDRHDIHGYHIPQPLIIHDPYFLGLAHQTG